MKHQRFTLKCGILKIVGELNGIEVASIRTELAEHAVAKVVLIVVEHSLLLACLRIFVHVGDNLDGSIGAGFLAQCTSRTLVTAVIVALECQAPTVTCCHMQCRLAVLGILLCALVGRSEERRVGKECL